MKTNYLDILPFPFIYDFQVNNELMLIQWKRCQQIYDV